MCKLGTGIFPTYSLLIEKSLASPRVIPHLNFFYRRTVRGPLAIVKESWVEKKPTEGNIVSHVLEIRRRLATMQKIVKVVL